MRDTEEQQRQLAVLSPDRATAMLISTAMDPVEWCRHRLSLLVFC